MITSCQLPWLGSQLRGRLGWRERNCAPKASGRPSKVDQSQSKVSPAYSLRCRIRIPKAPALVLEIVPTTEQDPVTSTEVGVEQQSVRGFSGRDLSVIWSISLLVSLAWQCQPGSAPRCSFGWPHRGRRRRRRGLRYIGQLVVDDISGFPSERSIHSLILSTHDSPTVGRSMPSDGSSPAARGGHTAGDGVMIATDQHSRRPERLGEFIGLQDLQSLLLRVREIAVLLGTCRCSATGTTPEDHRNADGQRGNLTAVPGELQRAVPGKTRDRLRGESHGRRHFICPSLRLRKRSRPGAQPP